MRNFQKQTNKQMSVFRVFLDAFGPPSSPKSDPFWIIFLGWNTKSILKILGKKNCQTIYICYKKKANRGTSTDPGATEFYSCSRTNPLLLISHQTLGQIISLNRISDLARE